MSTGVAGALMPAKPAESSTRAQQPGVWYGDVMVEPPLAASDLFKAGRRIVQHLPYPEAPTAPFQDIRPQSARGRVPLSSPRLASNRPQSARPSALPDRVYLPIYARPSAAPDLTRFTGKAPMLLHSGTAPAAAPPTYDIHGRRVCATSSPSRANRARAAARAPPPPPNLTVHRPDHRLSPRQRRQYQQYELDFQTDRFLEVRARLPSHRTVTKARKAELHECFKAVDRDRMGLIQVDDLGTMMIALGFSPEEIGATMACAACVDDPDHPEYSNRISPAEFARLCIEAEAAAAMAGGSGSTIAPPGGQFDAGPLEVLIGSYRIRGLVERYMRGEFASDPAGKDPQVPPWTRGAARPASAPAASSVERA
jgi:hypothetical protein